MMIRLTTPRIRFYRYGAFVSMTLRQHPTNPNERVRLWYRIGPPSVIDRVVKDLRDTAFSGVPMRDGVIDLSACTPEQLDRLKNTEVSMGDDWIKFKLHDKQKALETLARYMGMIVPERKSWRKRWWHRITRSSR